MLTLSGYESEEYLQKVASYINNKLAEYNRVESFRRQPADIQNILVELNIADDYFKAKKQIEELEEEPKEEFHVAPFTTKPEKKKLDFPVFKSSLFRIITKK